MAVSRFEDRGFKDSANALAGIFQKIGEFEGMRRDHQLQTNVMKVISDPVLTPDERRSSIFNEIANFSPEFAGGARGGLQRFAGGFSGPSQFQGGVAQAGISDVISGGPQRRSSDAASQSNNEIRNLVSLARDASAEDAELITARIFETLGIQAEPVETPDAAIVAPGPSFIDRLRSAFSGGEGPPAGTPGFTQQPSPVVPRKKKKKVDDDPLGIL